MQEQKSGRNEVSFGYGIASALYTLLVALNNLPSLETMKKSAKKNVDNIRSKVTQVFKKTSKY